MKVCGWCGWCGLRCQSAVCKRKVAGVGTDDPPAQVLLRIELPAPHGELATTSRAAQRPRPSAWHAAAGSSSGRDVEEAASKTAGAGCMEAWYWAMVGGAGGRCRRVQVGCRCWMLHLSLLKSCSRPFLSSANKIAGQGVSVIERHLVLGGVWWRVES